MNRLPDEYILPIADIFQNIVNWLVDEWRPVFQTLRWPIAQVLDAVSDLMNSLPFWLVILFFLIVGWRTAGIRNGVFCGVSFVLIAFMGLWDEAMDSLSILITAVTFCVVVGVPIGILAGRSNKFWAVLRPVLDVMQTTPSFVYLVPVVMLFGIGTVPGVIATIVFSMPPVIRLTNLGLRQVPAEAIEAGESFGATEWQALINIRLPLALPSIMTGVNQTLLMAMVMSVIISMIGAEGLGLSVLRGIGALDVGQAGIGGLAIVLLAISLDRITQGLGEKSKQAHHELKPRSLLGRFRAARTGASDSPASMQ
ncbi:ABC transporter permease [Salinicola peritrichatus]|uniref:ABC transporter permease n=1 Tax=Salinicola peritrichatus TaxID=1267424 RepID=UPI000DA128D2|nr:proline/glycine betaine ABC transporter permease [Salinicola peritrichatus]